MIDAIEFFSMNKVDYQFICKLRTLGRQSHWGDKCPACSAWSLRRLYSTQYCEGPL